MTVTSLIDFLFTTTEKLTTAKWKENFESVLHNHFFAVNLPFPALIHEYHERTTYSKLLTHAGHIHKGYPRGIKFKLQVKKLQVRNGVFVFYNWGGTFKGPELLTLKAEKCLHLAGTVVYFGLKNILILSYITSGNMKKVLTGKAITFWSLSPGSRVDGQHN